MRTAPTHRELSHCIRNSVAAVSVMAFLVTGKHMFYSWEEPPCMTCRYKQSFQQPAAATAALNYYRSLLDEITISPGPNYSRSAGTFLPHDVSP